MLTPLRADLEASFAFLLPLPAFEAPPTERKFQQTLLIELAQYAAAIDVDEKTPRTIATTKPEPEGSGPMN
jgi:hypothetical protein